MRKQLDIFHNTTNLEGATLQEATSKALSQDEEVLRLFKVLGALTLTPERVHKYLIENVGGKWERTPITSLRRSFSNLKNRGLIEKTNAMVKGNYGMPVNSWKLVSAD